MAYQDPYKPSDVKREGNSYSGMNVTGDNITINGKTPGGGFMVAGGLAARALQQAPAATPNAGAPAGALTNAANQSQAAPALSGSPQPGQIEQPAQGLAARALAQQSSQNQQSPVGAGNVTRQGNSYSGTNVTGDNISINGQTPGGGFMVSGGLAARAMAQQRSASQRSPVGMTVEQAQQQGLIGERVGYNPAYDQRINGGRVYNPAYDQEINESGMGGGLAARAMAQAAMQQREPYNPNVGSSSQWMGDLRDPRNLALRNASVGSTIFRNKGEEMMANKARQARIAGVQAAIGSQMHDAQQAETERYQSNNTLAGNLGAEQMRQDGENQRSLAQMALEQQKARTAAAQWGVENRGRSLVQAMQEQIATEQDPTKRKSLVQHMRDIEGRESTMAVPSGYRRSQDGQGLEYIPGGPADPRNKAAGPLNEGQSKALNFGARMQEAGRNLDELAANGVQRPSDIKNAADAVGLGWAANWAQSPQQQQVEQSQRDFVNAVLRKESGAAISNSEFDNARKQYFPQLGDDAQVIEQKRKNRELATRGMLAEVPDGQNRAQQVIGGGNASQQQQRKVVRTGTINGRRVVQYEDGGVSYAD